MLHSKATIIIPAHNEENNIYRVLNALEPNKNKSNFTIIVVCNACTDNTANVIKKNFTSVVCIETEIASKSLAIRHAETLDVSFPRMYLDADIELTGQEAMKIIKSSKDHPDKISMPTSRVNFTNVNIFVRLYYQYWYQTSYVRKLGYGCGVYVLSKRGRNKFGIWPDLISDDGFVRQFFSVQEVNLIHNSHVKVNAPKDLWSLIKIKIRSKYGSLQLREYLSKRHIKVNNTTPSQSSKKLSLIKLNYYGINSIAFIFAKVFFKFKAFNNIWLTDNSNR